MSASGSSVHTASMPIWKHVTGHMGTASDPNKKALVLDF